MGVDGGEGKKEGRGGEGREVRVSHSAYPHFISWCRLWSRLVLSYSHSVSKFQDRTSKTKPSTLKTKTLTPKTKKTNFRQDSVLRLNIARLL